MVSNEIPSSVYTVSAGINHYEKCHWIISHKFFVKTLSLKSAHLNTPQKVYDFLMRDFFFPVLLSIARKVGNFLHVIGVWKDMIIDYECHSLPLTIVTLKKICGAVTEFSHVIRGCAIFPSKRMKKAIG